MMQKELARSEELGGLGEQNLSEEKTGPSQCAQTNADDCSYNTTLGNIIYLGASALLRRFPSPRDSPTSPKIAFTVRSTGKVEMCMDVRALSLSQAKLHRPKGVVEAQH